MTDVSHPAVATTDELTQVSPFGTPDTFRATLRKGALYLGASIVLTGATFGVMVLANSIRLGIPGFGAAALVAVVGFVKGVLALARSRRKDEPVTVGAISGTFGVVVGSAFMAAVGAFGVLMSTWSFSRGRQLRRFGKVLLPPVGASDAWTTLGTRDEAIPEEVRAELADQWRENGRTEHASVAAFARLTLDLMALGAPPALLAASNRDSLDEIRHTEMCFSIAASIDGRAESPGAFPEASRARTLPRSRALALATLAVDSLVDGALHEGVSARVIAKLAKRCEVPSIAAALKEIASDEGRHSAHGWDVVEWCLAEGGDSVADALIAGIAMVPAATRTPLPARAEEGGWERYGIHGAALEADEYTKARADVIRRVEALLIARVRRAA